MRSEGQFLAIYGGSLNNSNHKQADSNTSPRFSSTSPTHIAPPITELHTLMNIHYSEIISRSLSDLRSLIIGQGKSNKNKSIIRLTLIVDRQNIRFREREEEVIEMFGELIQEVFAWEVKSFGVRLNWGEKAREMVGGGRRMTRIGVDVRRSQELHGMGTDFMQSPQ